MNIDLVFKIAAVGIIVAILNSLLSKSGRDEQAMLVTVAGIVVVMLMLAGEIGELFGELQSVFGF